MINVYSQCEVEEIRTSPNEFSDMYIIIMESWTEYRNCSVFRPVLGKGQQKKIRKHNHMKYTFIGLRERCNYLFIGVKIQIENITMYEFIPVLGFNIL